MFGECHAHMLLNGENYREAVALHKDHVCTEKIREYLMEYQKRDVLFVRDGGDGLGVSQTSCHFGTGVRHYLPDTHVCHSQKRALWRHCGKRV